MVIIIIMLGFRTLRVLRATYHVRREPVPEVFSKEGYYLYDKDGQRVSFWNDIPLGIRDDILTCCVEIPKSRIAKMEVIKQLPHHPIVQDTRQNLFSKELELRYYAQFPYFNYGFLPQTWQSTLITNQEGLIGDNDPVDIVEIGTRKFNIGDVFEAKVLGAFCLIDQGEVDWKVILLNHQEASEKNINKLEEVEEYPKVMEQIKRWFKGIKVFDGKKENTIAYDQKIFTKEETLQLIRDTHQHWEELRTSGGEEFARLRESMRF